MGVFWEGVSTVPWPFTQAVQVELHLGAGAGGSGILSC